MRWWHTLIIAGSLAACQADIGTAEVSGTIGGNSMNDVGSVFHGGTNILLFDREFDCLDVWWVASSYRDGDSPNEADSNSDEFVALQFAFETDPVDGTFSVTGDAAVSAIALENFTSGFDSTRARSGTLTVDEVGAETSIVGEFDVELDDGETVSGSFESVFCRNMK